MIGYWSKSEAPVSALQEILDKVLEIVPSEILMRSQRTTIPQMMMKCYNVLGEPIEEYEMRDVDIPELKGSNDIEAPEIPCNKFKQLSKK